MIEVNKPNVKQNYLSVLSKIRAAAENCGRNPDDVRLIAVSKTKPVEYAIEAYEAGAVDFGENRPQELVLKQEVLPEARWHQIGHLQKNKVRHIVGRTALIHSVDSIELAAEIDKRAKAAELVQDVLLQVNISGEATKFGVSPQELPKLIDRIKAFENVDIKGLMTISVAGYSREQNKHVFSQLKELAEKFGLHELSMGMSHDYTEAIECGATMVRIGTSIFGERDYSQK